MSAIAITSSNFEAEVMKSDLPVLLDFWAPWCGPCKMLGPIIEEVATETTGTVKVGKVNVDEQPELAQSYGIESIPTLLVMKNGKVVQTSAGFRPKREVLALLK